MLDSITALPDVEDRLLDAGEVAAILNVPKGWVRRHTQSGELPCLHLGRYRRYRRSAILAWLDKGGAS